MLPKKVTNLNSLLLLKTFKDLKAQKYFIFTGKYLIPPPPTFQTLIYRKPAAVIKRKTNKDLKGITRDKIEYFEKYIKPIVMTNIFPRKIFSLGRVAKMDRGFNLMHAFPEGMRLYDTLPDHEKRVFEEEASRRKENNKRIREEYCLEHKIPSLLLVPIRVPSLSGLKQELRTLKILYEEETGQVDLDLADRMLLNKQISIKKRVRIGSLAKKLDGLPEADWFLKRKGLTEEEFRRIQRISREFDIYYRQMLKDKQEKEIMEKLREEGDEEE